MNESLDESTKKYLYELIQRSLHDSKSDAAELYRYLSATQSEIQTARALTMDVAFGVQPEELPLDNTRRNQLLLQVALADLIADRILSDLQKDHDLGFVMLGAWQSVAQIKTAAGKCLGLQLQAADASKLERAMKAQRAANALHDKAGGSREKAQKMRELWASGKYTSRDRCAEEECGALGMSFSSARKALRNTPPAG